MRIISGSLRGRQFNSPHSQHTHPMSEKARGAIFNALGDIDGLHVLDAFAGSGALSFEAISHGAISAWAIELDKQAFIIIQQNILSLGLSSKVKATKANVLAWSKSQPQAKFDLVFADPPYDSAPTLDLSFLAVHLKPGGLLVLSWPTQQEIPKLKGLANIQTKGLGDAQVIFYRSLTGVGETA